MKFIKIISIYIHIFEIYRNLLKFDIKMNLLAFFDQIPYLHNILLFLGFITLVPAFYNLFSFIYRKFLRFPKNLMKVYGKEDSWAVVTGSSDGIGKAFCEALGKRGFNICFIARNPEKLAQVRKEFQAQYPSVKTAVIVADFSVSSQNPIEFYNNINENLSKENVNDIAILINNAGYSDMFYFDKMSEKDMADMISINVYPVVFLSKVIIPKMLNREKRSLIMNLASVSAVVPFPYISVYAATKSFNLVLSRCLGLEYEGKIDVMPIKPNYVSTKMSRLRPGGHVVTPKECVEGCLRDAGWEEETSGSWKHAALEWLIRKVIPKKILLDQSQATLKRIEERRKKN